MIKRLIGVAIACISIWTSFWFELYNDLNQERFESMKDSCALYTIGLDDCRLVYATTRDRIIPVLTYVRQSINSGDVFESKSMKQSVVTVMPMLESKKIQSLSQEKKILIDLLLLGLQDTLQYADTHATSIRISRSQIDAIQNDVLWNPILTEVRQTVIKQLMQQGFDGFVTQPYRSSLGILQTHPNNRTQRVLNQNIPTKDQIDILLYEFINSKQSPWGDLLIPQEVYKNRKGIYLFKNASDLQNLWYTVVSHRERLNTDAEYRRANIATAFREIGNLRVLNPWQSISYLWDSNFDMNEQQLYRNGTAIFLDQEVEAYGGGLCGWSTALYQWTFLNQSLTFTARNHSKRYTDLYTATINGEVVTTPWMDSTIYSPNLDLKITNTAPYPIIIVMNYDGTYAGVEEVFTMTPNLGDQWTYRFVQSWPRNYSLAQKDWSTRSTQWRCYEREIHEKLTTRCYKEVF